MPPAKRRNDGILNACNSIYRKSAHLQLRTHQPRCQQRMLPLGPTKYSSRSILDPGSEALFTRLRKSTLCDRQQCYRIVVFCTRVDFFLKRKCSSSNEPSDQLPQHDVKEKIRASQKKSRHFRTIRRGKRNRVRSQYPKPHCGKPMTLGFSGPPFEHKTCSIVIFVSAPRNCAVE